MRTRDGGRIDIQDLYSSWNLQAAGEPVILAMRAAKWMSRRPQKGRQGSDGGVWRIREGFHEQGSVMPRLNG